MLKHVKAGLKVSCYSRRNMHSEQTVQIYCTELSMLTVGQNGLPKGILRRVSLMRSEVPILRNFNKDGFSRLIRVISM